MHCLMSFRVLYARSYLICPVSILLIFIYSPHQAWTGWQPRAWLRTMRRSSAFRPYKLAPSAERSTGVKRDYTASAPISPRRRSSEVR